VTAFAAALNAGRLEAAIACFTRDACLVTPDATAVHGREQIRLLLAQMIARETQIEIVPIAELQAGEVAVTQQRWIVRSRGAAGARYTQQLDATLVLRRLESRWKLAIAAPWRQASSPISA
jgi:uncharacterized protein (TIGR02246 family)